MGGKFVNQKSQVISWIIFLHCCVWVISSLGSQALARGRRLPELSWENPIHPFSPAPQNHPCTELSEDLSTTCITIALETLYHCSYVIWSHYMATPLEPAMTILKHGDRKKKKAFTGSCPCCRSFLRTVFSRQLEEGKATGHPPSVIQSPQENRKAIQIKVYRNTYWSVKHKIPVY